jgi:hypothetical protein
MTKEENHERHSQVSGSRCHRGINAHRGRDGRRPLRRDNDRRFSSKPDAEHRIRYVRAK